MELKDVLPAILSFIVGLLGVSVQVILIYINRKKEFKKLSYENIQNIYLPLLSLLKKYEIYRTFLIESYDGFKILEKPIHNKDNIEDVYLNLIKVYREIEKVLGNKFTPIDKKLNSEVFRLLYHVNRVIISIDSKKYNFHHAILKSEEENGIDVSNLIKLIEDIF